MSNKKSTSEIVCDNNNNNVFDDCVISHLKLKEVTGSPSGTVGRAVQPLANEANENCGKTVISQ